MTGAAAQLAGARARRNRRAPVTPPPPTGPPYRWPGTRKIWGAADPQGGHSPVALTFDNLKSQVVAAGGVLNSYRPYFRQSNAGANVLNTVSITRHNGGAACVWHMQTDVTASGFAGPWSSWEGGAFATLFDNMCGAAMNSLTYADDGSAPPASIFTPDSEFDRRQREDPARFIGMWQWMYNRLRVTGPYANHPNNSRVLLGWCPTEWGMWHTLAGGATGSIGAAGNRDALYWPGDQYVDIFCPDCYNKLGEWGTSPSWTLPQWHTLGMLFDMCRQWTIATGLGIGKQIMIVENDCQSYGTICPSWDTTGKAGLGPFPANTTDDNGFNKGRWYKDGALYIKANDDCVGVIDWNVDYPPNDFALAFTDFKTAAATIAA